MFLAYPDIPFSDAAGQKRNPSQPSGSHAVLRQMVVEGVHTPTLHLTSQDTEKTSGKGNLLLQVGLRDIEVVICQSLLHKQP
jgi:hypothetical protein